MDHQPAVVSPAAELLCKELRHTVHARVYADSQGDLVWTKSFIPTVKHLDCLLPHLHCHLPPTTVEIIVRDSPGLTPYEAAGIDRGETGIG